MERTEFFNRGFDEGGALRFVSDIGLLKNRGAAVFTDVCGGFFAAVSLDIAKNDGGAFGGSHAGAAKADALGGAGDEDDLAHQSICHTRLFAIRRLPAKSVPAATTSGNALLGCTVNCKHIRASAHREPCGFVPLARTAQAAVWIHADLPFGMKPGTPVFTTGFSRCLV